MLFDLILLTEEGSPAASHTMAGMMVERTDGAKRVRCGAPGFFHTVFRDAKVVLNIRTTLIVLVMWEIYSVFEYI